MKSRSVVTKNIEEIRYDIGNNNCASLSRSANNLPTPINFPSGAKKYATSYTKSKLASICIIISKNINSFNPFNSNNSNNMQETMTYLDLGLSSQYNKGYEVKLGKVLRTTPAIRQQKNTSEISFLRKYIARVTTQLPNITFQARTTTANHPPHIA